MLRPLVLTGCPAVGKTTCGRTLATERPRAAHVDADDIRQLVVAGDATFWSGDEGRAQHALAARNACALGRTLDRAGFDVTVADIVTDETLPIYRAELPDCLVVHLAIDLDAARARATTRPVYITDDEFELLHRLTAVAPDVDLVLDVTDMTVAEQVGALRDAWTESR